MLTRSPRPSSRRSATAALSPATTRPALTAKPAWKPAVSAPGGAATGSVAFLEDGVVGIFGIPLEDHIRFCLEAMRANCDALGLRGNPASAQSA